MHCHCVFLRKDLWLKKIKKNIIQAKGLTAGPRFQLPRFYCRWVDFVLQETYIPFWVEGPTFVSWPPIRFKISMGETRSWTVESFRLTFCGFSSTLGHLHVHLSKAQEDSVFKEKLGEMSYGAPRLQFRIGGDKSTKKCRFCPPEIYKVGFVESALEACWTACMYVHT
jgi:hypothetical protein